MWLYANGGDPVVYNDDASSVSPNYTPIEPTSLTNGADDYWSFARWGGQLQDGSIYVIEVSSYTNADNFDYELQVAKVNPLINVYVERIPSPYVGTVDDGVTWFSGTVLPPIALSGGQWWIDTQTLAGDGTYAIGIEMWDASGNVIYNGDGPLYGNNASFAGSVYVLSSSITWNGTPGIDTEIRFEPRWIVYDYYGSPQIGVSPFLNDGFDTPLEEGIYQIQLTFAGYDTGGGEIYSPTGTCNFQFQIVPEPPQPPVMIHTFAISANPNYSTSSQDYLEAYPMWYGTNASVYMTASTATPNPPKTGHAAFGYNSTTGLVNVSSSASTGNYKWDGSYNPVQTSNASPWIWPQYAMNQTGPNYLTKGYAGAYYSASLNDGINWRAAAADPNRFNDHFQLEFDAGLPAPSSSTNYYAQTLVSSYSYNFASPQGQQDATGWGLDENTASDNENLRAKVLHVISYGGSGYTTYFSDLESIYVECPDPGEVPEAPWLRGSTPLAFKKISDYELLVWLPGYRAKYDTGLGDFPISPMWPDVTTLYGLGHPQEVRLVFTKTSTGEESIVSLSYFTGV
jgi:hypothetical protein